MRPIAHIVIVDDDKEIRRLLGRYLTEQGFRVSLAGSRREFEEHLKRDTINLAILDVMLPDGSGIDICRTLRATQPDLQIILLTALIEEVDRIIGLEVGADDYLGKPFSPRELLARVRSVLRRGSGVSSPVEAPRAILVFENIRVEMGQRRVVSNDGREVPFTSGEFDLFSVLVQRPGRVLSRDQLIQLTQGHDANPLDRSVDVMVSRIRRKLADVCPAEVLKTVRNGGYLLATQVERLSV
jgi:two-component system OmpR family response regulator